MPTSLPPGVVFVRPQPPRCQQLLLLLPSRRDAGQSLLALGLFVLFVTVRGHHQFRLEAPVSLVRFSGIGLPSSEFHHGRYLHHTHSISGFLTLKLYLSSQARLLFSLHLLQVDNASSFPVLYSLGSNGTMPRCTVSATSLLLSFLRPKQSLQTLDHGLLVTIRTCSRVTVLGGSIRLVSFLSFQFVYNVIYTLIFVLFPWTFPIECAYIHILSSFILLPLKRCVSQYTFLFGCVMGFVLWSKTANGLFYLFIYFVKIMLHGHFGPYPCSIFYLFYIYIKSNNKINTNNNNYYSIQNDSIYIYW